MADAFPIDLAQIVALFLESLFYGIFLVSFGMCMYTMLVKARHRKGRRNVFLIVALFFFIVATLDVALLLRHVLDAFIWYRGSGGAPAELSNISYWVNVMKTVTYVAQTSIGDGMLIYRCYVVYAGHGWLVAIPLCILWVAGMIVSAFWCYVEFTFHANALLNTRELKPFVTSTTSITLVLNLIATSLIVCKIWSVERNSRRAFAGTVCPSNVLSLRRAMHIIIESGLMYSVSVVVFFVLYFASNNAQYGVSDCTVQIIGIAFNLIIIRVEQGKAVERTYVPESGRLSSKQRSIRFRIPRQATTLSSVTAVDRGEDAERTHAIAMMARNETRSPLPDDRGSPVSPV